MIVSKYWTFAGFKTGSGLSEVWNWRWLKEKSFTFIVPIFGSIKISDTKRNNQHCYGWLGIHWQHLVSKGIHFWIKQEKSLDPCCSQLQVKVIYNVHSFVLQHSAENIPEGPKLSILSKLKCHLTISKEPFQPLSRLTKAQWSLLFWLVKSVMVDVMQGLKSCSLWSR